MTDQHLIRLVERIERLIEDISGLREDVRDVYSEAKACGYDAKMLRTLVKRRAMNPADRREADALLVVYESALGMADEHGEDAEKQALLALAEAKAAQITEGRLAQLAGLVALLDPDAEQQVVALIAAVLDLRAQRKEVTGQISAMLKAAKPSGIDGARVTEVCRRVERIDKHGRDAVLAAEATRDGYADAFERAEAVASGAIASATSDPALVKMLTPPPAEKKRKVSRADEALIWAKLGGKEG